MATLKYGWKYWQIKTAKQNLRQALAAWLVFTLALIFTGIGGGL